MRLLLAEDDPVLASGLESALTLEGYQVTCLGDGLQVQHALRDDTFGLLILDLGLPGCDGIQILGELRSRLSMIPVLVLTARDQLNDRVRCLDLGADDFLLKPFHLPELTARLRALRRRYGGRAEVAIRHGALCFDPVERRVTLGDKEVNLTAREFTLAEALLESAGRVMTREQLEQLVYGWTDGVESNAIEVHIHNLRRKLGRELVRTIRGVGYMVPRVETGPR